MKPKILVVEDELLVARDIREILEEEGYEVHINITSVEQAIQVIEAEMPSLVLIDINLGNCKDGTVLGHYLLEKDRIPYIYITSYSDKVTLANAKDTRPHGYIVKPFKPADIKTTVALVLNNYRHRSIDVMRESTELNSDTPFILKETIRYINAHISERIEISELVMITKWKEDHFIRIFTKYMGITPYQYILSAKVDKAAAVLLETDLTVIAIANDLGFSSYSNFCNAFKKKYGLTPEAYRVQCGVKRRL